MTTEPTDAELDALRQADNGALNFVTARAFRIIARAVRAKWGQPSGAGEAAEHYRNAIASACEGWTMPDGLRKHLETALWSPPTPQPTQAVPTGSTTSTAPPSSAYEETEPSPP